MISTLSGNVNNFGGMVAIRFCIGFVEAAFLPGALLILSKWYTRRELTLRNAILFCGNLISNAFSSLVGAAVLGNMEGTLGHEAWRWLYWYVFYARGITFKHSDHGNQDRGSCYHGNSNLCGFHSPRPAS